MIYLLLKRFLKWSFLFFFRNKVISGQENIPTNGPIIIAINHPNTLIDPLLVASQIKRRVGFLANASLFINGAVKTFLSYFWVIPVFRKKDVKSGEKQDNTSSFQKCYEFFDREGALLIFPEGTSVNELKLREIKTGTARIALGYEGLKDFTGGLKIVTVAISYSDSLRFRSMVSIQINPAFDISEYKDDWENDETLAIQDLTNRIKKEIGGKITLTDDKEQEKVVLNAQQFYLAYINPSVSRYYDAQASFDYRKKIATSLSELQKTNKTTYDQLKKNLASYFSTLSSFKLTIGFFKDSFLHKKSYLLILFYILELIVLLPFYVFGLLFNYIPYRIPLLLFNIVKPDIEYRATTMLLVGMLVFPLYYWLNVFLFRSYFSTDLLWTLLLLVSMPILGYLSLFFWKIAKRLMRVFRFYSKVNMIKKNEMIALRDVIIKELNAI